VPEQLCEGCGIAAARVLRREPAGIIAVPVDAAGAGHVMVVSGAHATAFSELDESGAAAFMTLVSRTVRAAEQASGGRHYYILRIGDLSPHLHVHLVPASTEVPLAPFVFGASGWSGGTRAPADPAFESVLLAALEHSR
jgi:diadenosine tetraphosphate (Ap4A) HIT family hydrolase